MTTLVFFWLKESPCSTSELSYNGADFITSFGDFSCVSPGLTSTDISPSKWVKAYSCVTGIFKGGEDKALRALRSYQKKINLLQANRDEMMMANTWGDRSQDEKINESFCLHELDAIHRLGLNCFQIDDGWQTGKSPNSKFSKGSFNDIWKQKNYWKPNPQKFPNGFTPIVEKANRLGIRIGLWFNPSIQNDFADWGKDASVMIGLYKQYGIKIFKIDGLNVSSKLGEERIRAMLDSVDLATNHQAVINLDVTAGRRFGYHMMNEYGNIFLENRYTDWGNYYPWLTLRNLWQLSKYVPSERLQIEFLNNYRNVEKYAPHDWLSPSNYRFDYIFAICMAAQPLAWMETSALCDNAFNIRETVKIYEKIQHDFHSGTILPIGEEPSGKSWTGFQSILNDREGYLLIYREHTDSENAFIKTWLPKDFRIKTKNIIGNGKIDENSNVGSDGAVNVTINRINDYVLLKYEIL